MSACGQSGHMIMKLGRFLVSAASLFAVALCSTGCLAGKYMVNFALKPAEHGQELEADRAKWERWIPGIMDWYDALHAAGEFKDTVISDRNGLKLHAVYAAASKDAPVVAGDPHGTAVLVHGYTDNHLCMMHLARMYRDSLGFNVLVPDLHHHGLSEGDAIQMGWLDRLDVEKWIEVAHGIFQDDLMVVHGVSMGGATTMMVSGDELPEYVRGFVDDCGYSSVWDQFAKQLKEQFHLPPFPILTSANIVCRKKYGWDFKEASSLDQLAKSTRPMLFIHGDTDDFVLTSDVYRNFEAKTQGYKEMWLAPNTDHASSYKNHPAEYTQHVREFLRKL